MPQRARDGQYITGLVISAIPMPQLAYISANYASPRFDCTRGAQEHAPNISVHRLSAIEPLPNPA